MKTIILQRQARDKHRETSKKSEYRTVFLQMPDMIFDGVDFSTANASLVASMPGQCWDSRYNQTDTKPDLLCFMS